MKGTMKAARLYAPGDLRYEDVAIPEINADQVLIRVKAVGICGSDPARVMRNGTYSYPTTVGHEFAGEVVEIGNKAKTVRVGERVTVYPLIPCGTCPYCMTGEYNLCEKYSYYGSREDGAMAEYIAVNPANVIKLPPEVDFESGACTDPISVALHAIRQSKLTAGNSIAILGIGPIGLFTIQWAKIFGAKEIFAVDVFDEKLELAKKLGVDYVINSKQQDPVEFLKKATGNSGADCVIELAGSKITQAQSLLMAGKNGRVVFCGISYDDLVIPKANLDCILRKELTITGAWNSTIIPVPVNEWLTSLHFMAKGQIECAPLISHRLPLQEASATFLKVWAKKEPYNKVLFFP